MLDGATSASLEWLQAPSATRDDGVTLGGQTFGDATSTGELGGTLRTGAAGLVPRRVPITIPPASAVMLTQRLEPRRPRDATRRSCGARGTAVPRACPARPGTASSSSRDAARIASGEPKWVSSARLRAGPTPGSSSRIEAVIAVSRRCRWWVIANRCASSRTRWSSCSSGVSCASASGAARPGMNTSSIRFASETTTHSALAEPRERPQPGRQLALAAVDHDQVRQRGEARVVLLVVRRDVALALPLREPPAEHLLHRREVVREPSRPRPVGPGRP